MLLTIPNSMTTSAARLRLRMTPAERVRGRFMRAPDGHDAGGAPAAASGSEGDGEGTDDATDDATVLGGTGAGAEGEAGAGEADPAGGEGGAPIGAPEVYDLKAPEGMEFDTAAFEAAEPVLRELGLSNDAAQKLVSTYAEKIMPQLAERANAAITQRAADQRREWADAFAADAEFGGANKDRTVADAARAFDHYGLKKGEGLRQLLDESGLGNHPDLIRFVARVGRDLDEGTFERGDAVSAPKSPEQKLYGTEFQPKG